MAEIRPFTGLRYSSKVVRRMEAVTAPPYDVISSEEQQLYHGRSKYNVIRLELGLELEGDSTENNRYTRSRDLFLQWLRDGVLVPEPRPALYLYEHEFELRGAQKVRPGIVACLRLEELDSGIVLPHEDTLDKPLGDRLNLMRACHANFSPVFGLFEDRGARMAGVLEATSRRRPELSLNTGDGELHRLWVIDDPTSIRIIAESLAPAQVFIADGHHRYKTALRYRDEVRAVSSGCTGDEAFNFVMALLVDINSPGLAVMPTHRVVMRDFSAASRQIERRLSDWFDIRQFPANGDAADGLKALLREMESSAAANVFGACGLRKDYFSLLISRDARKIQDAMPREKSAAWRSLDVSVLKSIVLERAVGVSEEEMVREGTIEYVADENVAAQAVAEGKASMAWFLRPATVSQVRDVALAADRMPRKSTYFHPKPLTGLVINHLEGDLPRVV